MSPVSTMGAVLTAKNTVARGVAEIGDAASGSAPTVDRLARAGSGSYDQEIALHRLRASVRSNNDAPMTGVVLGGALGALIVGAFMSKASAPSTGLSTRGARRTTLDAPSPTHELSTPELDARRPQPDSRRRTAEARHPNPTARRSMLDGGSVLPQLRRTPHDA